MAFTHRVAFSVLVACLAGGCLQQPPVSTTSSGGGISSAGTSTGRSVGTSTGRGSSTGAAASSGGGNTTGGAAGCVTAADCASGEVCLDGGCSAPLVLQNLLCTGVGQTCTPTGAPCCQGNCSDAGFCTAWSACGLLGGQCQNTGDCCSREVCDAGTCVPACGYLASPCGQDGDCCTALGLVCRPPAVPNGNPLECVSQRPIGGVSCTPQRTDSTIECNLGTGCIVAGDVDPCAPAGYVCDSFYGACRQPLVYEACLPGGPACQGIANSSLSGLRCVYVPFRGHAQCLQPCEESSDCLSYSTSCQSLSGVAGDACFSNFGCTDYFGPCDAAAFGDGTCTPDFTSSGLQGICDQAANDGGVACNHTRNRQEGGFCAVGEACIAGLCTQLCNAGTDSSGPSCSSGTCVSGSASGDPVDYGVCESNCDFTDPDGGGCPSTPEVAEKCIPAFQDGFPDLGNGFCGLAASTPPGLGQPCSQQDPLHIDSCGAAQACAALSDSEVICVQLCTGPGTTSNCPAGKRCKTWYNGGPSTIMGYCG